MAESQDLVVIGGGSGGFAAAVRSAQLGGTVTVVEEAHVGGKCMNHNCIPLTFLMTAARRTNAIREAGHFGIQAGDPELDVDALHDEKDLLVEGLRMGTREQLVDYGVEIIDGRGKLTAVDTVQVTGEQDREIKARNVLVATGAVQAQLPIEGADLPGVIGTEEADALREIPPRVVVIGNQAWDFELAQYFNWIGSQVTLITPSRQMIPEADREISQRLAKLLHDSGVGVKRGVAVEAIGQGEDGSLTVVLANDGEEVPADKVVAVRHLPNSAGLGLRQVGVRMDEGAVRVDERMRTNVAGIYAIGDVTAGPMWSHKANAEGIVAAENAMGVASTMDYDSMPRCFHTSPSVAWVGLTQDQAEDRGLEIAVGKVPIAINPYAMILNQTAGAIKIVAGKRYGRILGVHMVGPGALDLINVAAVAMLSEATIHELMRFIPAHPSIGEALVDAAMDVEKRSLHLPKW
ncbi:MAG: dihydrolipoyl dehydrogenase family protein [Chloroflexota bacterium]